MPAIYDFEVPLPSGGTKAIAEFAGQVLLIVNTASKCGFTPQYRGLGDLHTKYAAQGFTVLGFPCDQFGGQEPGSNDEITQFCSTAYNVPFPIFAKIEVNGPKSLPLYNFLKNEAKGLLGSSRINWNFTKFLVDRDGGVVARYAPMTTPARLAPKIQNLLQT